MTFSRNLKDTVTIWPVTGDDGYGGYTFSAPIIITARWEDSQQKFFTANGEESISQAVVHVDRDITEGDWIAFGDQRTYASPTVDGLGGYKIRGFTRISNLRNSSNNRKVFI